jgi:cyclic-di-GMP phosphodiesterase, flagellum assembly factor TipF
MVRISAIFIAVCMVLIAGSVGFVVYLRFGLTGAESFLIGLGVLTSLAVYNAIAARSRDRREVSDQIATLSRASADLARQVAEHGRQFSVLNSKVDAVVDKALASARPLATEIEELSTLVKRLADQVAAHEAAFNDINSGAPASAARAVATAPPATVNPVAAVASAAPAASAPAPAAEPAAPPVAAAVAPAEGIPAAFKGLDHAGVLAAIDAAIEANRIDLYLQPIVTLPQRKVRYYEALSRLKTDGGDLVAAGDFIKFAEAGSLMPKLDKLSVLRCVQVVRRLLLKNREIGLFCNLSAATLTNVTFPQLLEFIEANRAIAPALVFEFTQNAVRGMGPIEHESLAALAERGFRFSMDNLTDLRVEPRELTERGFRFVKAPAALLLNRLGGVSSDIHPADLSDLLGRFGIDLIAERIEAEGAVVDLLDYDVRFGQGFLFSPPRPVRAEALAGSDLAKGDPARSDAGETRRAGAPSDAGASRPSLFGQLMRAGVARS